MGSKSDSSQKQSTTNTNIQQSFTDNSTTDIFEDNSQQFDLANDGTLAGATVTGNISITDGGAFNLAGEALRAMESNSLEGWSVVGGVAADSLYNMKDVTSLAITSQAGLAEQFGSFMQSAVRDSIYAQNDLAKSLSADITATSGDAMNTVLDQTKYALEFANNATRSDGQQLAISSNKTMMVAFVSVAGVALAFVVFRSKK